MYSNEIQVVIDRVSRLRELGTPVVVALDGRSGTGKSTLGLEIATVVNGTYVDQDDFFCGGELDQWRAVSPEIRVDKCIDWQRVLRDIVLPFRASRPIHYHPFNWDTMDGLDPDPITIEPSDVLILDGAYSTRAELADYLDLTVLVTLDDEIRRQRIMDREGEDWTLEWFTVWDAAEDLYFGKMRPESEFDIVIRRS
ncbi:hypothetical protein K6Y76_36865 [Burkholderia cenocepacia]|uniref:uridine kinase family protein n=1 Tax=Burkholderia cenocepacia TaxID=95486 RepID=UPI002230EEB6|nr:hypothetical protein [Burkholderia cenocepacia]MCW3528566.1 hypothetical protein [Burkholderia cenocepacia]MCW3618614.1 hypothetical protein [Burkholderia cenocepacia]MCW3656445.1 hypothetical protein [Burkholderia cenocepacia]MCW3671576.1 hypothetical protein [Burkholderia cenocepacia]MCW3686305.1 hypothetical protein [Burkholderia cenocepacia]